MPEFKGEFCSPIYIWLNPDVAAMNFYNSLYQRKSNSCTLRFGIKFIEQMEYFRMIIFWYANTFVFYKIIYFIIYYLATNGNFGYAVYFMKLKCIFY